MNQNEFSAKVKESEEIRERAMQMAKESNEWVDTDLKKATQMLIESMELWQRGCAMLYQVTSQDDGSELNAEPEKGSGEIPIAMESEEAKNQDQIE